MEKYRIPDSERLLLERLPTPLAVYQFVDGHVFTLALSEGFCTLFGYTDRTKAYSLMEENIFYNTHPDDVARISDTAYRFATEGGDYEVIFRARKYQEQEYRIIHGLGKHIYTREGVRLAYVWYTDEGAYTGDDTTQATALNRTFNSALHEESILKASYYDYLTGLPSMTHFFELAASHQTVIMDAGSQPVLLYMDLFGMKRFNSKYGFAEGDHLLQEVGRCLTEVFRDGICSHFGADNFVVVTKEDRLEESLEAFFRKCQALNDGKNLPVHVGIYPHRVDSVTVTVACDRAKFACDALRNTYSSCFNYYSQKLRDEEDLRQHILENLDRAIEENWIQVYYQPIVRTVSGKACDDEALSRWIDPERGFLSPADFIPALEEAGLIYKLDLYVLEQVLEKLKLQEAKGIHTVPQSINLSRSDFDACDIVEEIRKRVDEAGVRRDMISIEITESIIGSDFDFIKAQIDRFRALGFPIWMDDFGSGYSSLDTLQSIQFDLVKFDMSFIQRLNEGSGRIILTELVRMVNALGIGTICEGVETEAQARFLQEIGCSKQQGFYFCKPTPLPQIMERYEAGTQTGNENPDEFQYYETIGNVNLYDLAVISNEDDINLQTFFSTMPMAILEIQGEDVRFVRSNRSYRDFVKRFFGLEIAESQAGFTPTPFGPDSSFLKLVKQCCDNGTRAFYDEKMPDGSIVHSFARRIGRNPVTGTTAAVVAVLSITDETEGATYASIARALAADYYNIYYVDLDTDDFIEYSSPVGAEELAMERHGKEFFEAVKRDSMTRIYEEDRAPFLASFSKERIIKELDEQGVFTTTYRLIDTGTPMYVNMKITRMPTSGNHIILGISIVDSQMRQKEESDLLQMEAMAYARVMALSGSYLGLYTVDPDSGRYLEYSATQAYESLGFAKRGEDFFRQGLIDGSKTVHPEDWPAYSSQFTKENVLQTISETGSFLMQYRLIINDTPVHVGLKIVLVRERDGDKLIVGVREWKQR